MTETRAHCASRPFAAAAPLQRAAEAIDTAARALAGGVGAPADVDAGEEGARMLALKTRLQLSATTHSLAAESRKSVLALLDPAP